MIAAIVPACGLSQRMGRPKLILSVGGTPQIERVVRGLVAGGVARVICVVPPGHQPGAPKLAETAQQSGAEVVIADPAPSQMRETVEMGLHELSRVPGSRIDAVLLTPGDALGVTDDLVLEMISRFQNEELDLVIATFQGKWGHPVMMRWSLAEQIPQIPEGQGINSLVKRPGWRIAEVASKNPAVIADLDTPEDLARWSPRLSGG